MFPESRRMLDVPDPYVASAGALRALQWPPWLEAKGGQLIEPSLGREPGRGGCLPNAPTH
jgi:hypothetical protein